MSGILHCSRKLSGVGKNIPSLRVFVCVVLFYCPTPTLQLNEVGSKQIVFGPSKRQMDPPCLPGHTVRCVTSSRGAMGEILRSISTVGSIFHIFAILQSPGMPKVSNRDSMLQTIRLFSCECQQRKRKQPRNKLVSYGHSRDPGYSGPIHHYVSIQIRYRVETYCSLNRYLRYPYQSLFPSRFPKLSVH